MCLAAVQTLSSLIWGLLNLKYKDGGEGSGRTGQPQLGSPGRTDNKEIWERFQGRKVYHGWKLEKKVAEEQKRPEGEYI